MDALTLPALSRAQVREVERRLVENYGINPLQTLEHSGRNLARLAQHMLEGDLADRPLVVLAGKGMNGAGGLVAARHLLNWGAWVQILCTDAPDVYEGVPAQQLHTLQAMGAPLAWAEEGWELPPCDLVLDAIIGVGLQGEPHGKARDLIQLANSSNALILCHDLPSGVDADSGNSFAPYVHATATLSMALPKAGLLANAASQPYGELFVGDVGVPLVLFEEMGLELSTIFRHEPIVRWEARDDAAVLMGA